MTALFLPLCLLLALAAAGRAAAEPAHGIGVYGAADLRLGPDAPWPYVNPHAPKGGALVMHTQSFTKLNPYSLKGIPAPLLDLVFESATVHSYADDEPASSYGHLVETIDLAPDRLSMTYRIRPEAAFSDGRPVTADDFVFSFELMRSEPEFHPLYKQYFADLKAIVKVDERTVRYEFARVNQELPLITGELPVLPRHVYGAPGSQFGRDFDTVAVGSGPYLVERCEFGKFITVRRNPDWWGRNLPRSRGCYNFDTITAKVYLDEVARKEAFKGGDFDVLMVNTAKDWALDFRGPFVQKNYILRREYPHSRPVNMQGYVFNLRRPLFQSLKTRYALALAFDFAWANANLFFGQYTRTRCFFENSPDLTDVAPPGGPLLDYLRDLRARHGPLAVPKAALEQPLAAPGAGQSAEESRRQAELLLDSVGWQKGADGIRVRNGQRLAFELLIDNQVWQRISEPWQQWLRRIGADLTITFLQPAEYEKRIRAFDYDLVLMVFGHSRSPGNELLGYYGSAAADTEGGANLAGLRNPAVDEVLDRLVEAGSRAELAVQARALDRILSASVLLVPHWHLNSDRTLLWNKFGLPATYCSQRYFESVVRDYGWFEPEREKRLRTAMAAGTALPAD
jgi:microcin C transport system substrate-binding protein